MDSRAPRRIGALLALGSLGLLGFWEWRDRTGRGPVAPEPASAGPGWAEGLDGAWSLAHADPDGADGGGPAGDLGAIGYAGGYEPAGDADDAIGARTLDPARRQAGYDLYCSGHGPEALLLDPDGEVVHRWRKDWRDLPGVPALDGPTQNTFRRVRLLPDGDLLAIYGGRGLVRLDRDSNVRWVYPERAHHDLDVDDAGRIWTLIRTERVEPRLNPDAPIVEDWVVRLAPDGREEQRVSVVEALLASPFADVLHEARVKRGDFLHTNTIQVLDRAAARAHPDFAAGALLLCLRDLDTFLVLDPVGRTVRWARRGVGRGPHEPQVTSAGTLLYFDNLGRAGHSQVVEVDPRSWREVWAWRPNPPSTFSSLFCGTAARLANGNTLIVESTKGRAFEVTPEHEVVWTFDNPRRAGRRDELVAAVYDLVRVDAAEVEGWLGD